MSKWTFSLLYLSRSRVYALSRLCIKCSITSPELVRTLSNSAIQASTNLRCKMAAIQPIREAILVQTEKAIYDSTVFEKDSSPTSTSSDSESISDRKASNPFADPEVATFYRSLYESTKYECLEAFDPDFQWTPKEEKKIIRKLDWRVSLLSVFHRPTNDLEARH